MSPVEIALRFIAAWLAVGLGLFVASGSVRALRPQAAPAGGAMRSAWRVAYVIPLLAGCALLAVGLIEAARVVPW